MKLKVSQIDPNPNRDLVRNPISDDQVTKVMESISRTGFWDNLVVRLHPEHSDRYQLAYGHNRIEACRRLQIEEVDLPVRELSDYDMYCCMVDENNTQQSVTPKIIFENVTAALILAERLLNLTKNVEEFNELVKTSHLSLGKGVKFWRINDYEKAIFAISEEGDGLGVDFLQHFMPTPIRNETLQNAIDSYYAGRRKRAAAQREAEARAAAERERAESERKAEEARKAEDARKAAERERAEAERKAREAEQAALKAAEKADEEARRLALNERKKQEAARKEAERKAKAESDKKAAAEKAAAKAKKEAEEQQKKAEREKAKGERMEYAGVDRDLLEQLPSTSHMNDVVALIKKHKIPSSFHAKLIDEAKGWSPNGPSTERSGTAISIKGSEWWDIYSGARADRMLENAARQKYEEMRRKFGASPFHQVILNIIEKFGSANTAARSNMEPCKEYFSTLSPDQAARVVKNLTTIKNDCNTWIDAVIRELQDTCQPKERDVTPKPFPSPCLEYQADPEVANV